MKFWKRGIPRGAVCPRLFPHGSPQIKTSKKEKISKPQIDKQIPLEMGTGGGGGGKKGGSGGKKPPEDKVEMGKLS